MTNDDRARNRRIGRRLKLERETRGISQSEMARRMRLTQSYISRIEAGKFNITLRILYQYAGMFGCGLSIRFTEECHAS